MGRGTFEKALAAPVAERLVRRTSAYAEPPGTVPRDTVDDPYLRFWLRFVQPGVELIARGRPDIAVERIEEGWGTYRGRAVEPLVRDSIERMPPDERFGDARFVGAFWTRDGRTEVDLVGGREPSRAGTVDVVGSVTWREREPFGREEVAAIAALRSRVPGATTATRLVGVSRSGVAHAAGLDVTLGPDDLPAAWQA